jgi:hypothetical protein|tara:strand:- start:549 stop:734 length:186 start_codon:yes stop_codon:yes gene_type:complete
MNNALEWFKAKENKTMTQEEKLEKIASIQKMILELKTSIGVENSKQTIQKLQQEIDELTKS